MTVRRAVSGDVPAMVALIQQSRVQLAEWRPVFWKPAEDAAAKSAAFFDFLVQSKDHLCFVHEEEGGMNGFLIAMPTPAPPVFAPGGATWTIDDFHVASDDLWVSTGVALLDAARAELKARGVVQVVAICPADYAAKAYVLADQGLLDTTHWLTQTL